MVTRRVLAVRHRDGHLELLEPLEISIGQRVAITVELPNEKHPPEEVDSLPVRDLGALKSTLARSPTRPR